MGPVLGLNKALDLFVEQSGRRHGTWLEVVFKRQVTLPGTKRVELWISAAHRICGSPSSRRYVIAWHQAVLCGARHNLGRRQTKHQVAFQVHRKIKAEQHIVIAARERGMGTSINNYGGSRLRRVV